MSDLSPAPTPTNEQQDARGEHIVTVEFEEGYGQHVRMTCHAPADSVCHAEFDCECESWWNTGVEDGRPWHATDYDNPDAERHYGKFTPDFCNLREWFSNSDDPMSGSVSFPVEASFEGDYYSFKPTPLAAVSAAAPDEREVEHLPFAPEQRWALWNEWAAAHPGDDVSEYDAFLGGLTAALAARPAPVEDDRDQDRADVSHWVEVVISEGYVTSAGIDALLDRIKPARPAPVVSGAMADAAIEALGMNAYMTPERMTAHHAALGVVWTDPRTVADAPAADDERPSLAPACPKCGGGTSEDSTDTQRAAGYLHWKCRVCGHGWEDGGPAADDEGGQER